MKNEEPIVLHELNRNITECISRSTHGALYCVYQKRIFGAEAGG